MTAWGLVLEVLAIHVVLIGVFVLEMWLRRRRRRREADPSRPTPPPEERITRPSRPLYLALPQEAPTTVYAQTEVRVAPVARRPEPSGRLPREPEVRAGVVPVFGSEAVDYVEDDGAVYRPVVKDRERR